MTPAMASLGAASTQLPLGTVRLGFRPRPVRQAVSCGISDSSHSFPFKAVKKLQVRHTARVPTGMRLRASAIDEDVALPEDWEDQMEATRRRPLRPVEERFNIYHEKNVTAERLKELGVERWSRWECGPCVTYWWTWEVDELIYVSKGSVEIVPDGCHDGAFFYAGDLFRIPKWFEASLTFDYDYEQYYKFFAYGD